MNSARQPLTADDRRIIIKKAFGRIGAEPPTPRPDEFCPCNQHLRIEGTKYCRSCTSAMAAVDVKKPSPFVNAAYAFAAVVVVVLIFCLVYWTTPATPVDNHTDQRIRSQKQ